MVFFSNLFFIFSKFHLSYFDAFTYQRWENDIVVERQEEGGGGEN